MTTDTVPQTVLFPDLFDKPLFAQFNQEQASSDGGAILLKAAERIYGLVKAFAGCLFDKRAPDKTRHSLADQAVASDGTVGLLSRLLPRLRRAFPRARILVRLDGGFASPAVFAFLEAQPRLDYVLAMAKNAVLKRYAEPAMLVARARTWRSEQTEHVYTETNEYQAGTWNHARRVVIKAEVVRHRDREPRDNPRFVVTNMRQTPRFLYEKVYCARGDAENRIKELKALQIDRTSCQTFSANQLRVLLTAAAYVLMQELRLRAADTACARAQVPWLRDRLLKLGVQVVCSVRRIVLRLPRATPDLAAWRHIAFALGARAG